MTLTNQVLFIQCCTQVSTWQIIIQSLVCFSVFLPCIITTNKPPLLNTKKFLRHYVVIHLKTFPGSVSHHMARRCHPTLLHNDEMPVIILTLFYWPTLSGHLSWVPTSDWHCQPTCRQHCLSLLILFWRLIMSADTVIVCVGGNRRVLVKLLLLTRERLSLMQSFRVNPLNSQLWNLALKNYRKHSVTNCDILNCLGIAQQYDRQTDRQMDRMPIAVALSNNTH